MMTIMITAAVIASPLKKAINDPDLLSELEMSISHQKCRIYVIYVYGQVFLYKICDMRRALFALLKEAAKWTIPGGGSPDTGGGLRRRRPL
jgi:hypothetical protein